MPKIEQDLMPAKLLHWVIGLLMACDAGAMFVHYLRISGHDQIGHISKVSTGVCILLSACAGIGYGFRMRTSQMLMLALLVHGLLGTLLHSYEFGYHFWGHVYYWIIMFFGFSLGRNARLDVKTCERLLIVLSQVVLFASTVGYMHLESYRGAQQGGVYNGYSGDQLLLPLSVFANFGRPIQAGWAFSLIVLSSRRGPLVAAVVAVVLLVAAKRTRHLWVAASTSLVPMSLVGWAAMAAMQMMMTSEVSRESAIARVAMKWDKLLAYEDDLRGATSGRNVELEGAWELMSGSSWDWVTGHGYGWEIPTTFFHFVHLSYVNYIITHGVLLGAVQIGLILFLVNRTHREAQVPSDRSRLLWTALTFQIAALVVSFTCAWILITLLFWVFLGIGSRPRDPLPALS